MGFKTQNELIVDMPLGYQVRDLIENVYTGTVNVRAFGAKGDGITDDTAAIQGAIDVGRTVFLPKGRYKVTRSLTENTDGVLKLVAADQAVLVQSEDVKTINVTIAYTDETTVTTLTAAATFDFGGGSNSNVTSLLLPDASAFAVDDVVKVFSDDVAPGTGANERMGEHGIIGGKSGNTLYLKSQLQLSGSYTSNIRIAKIGSSNVLISGVEFDSATEGDAALWDSDHVFIEGCNAPVLNSVKVVRGYGAAIVVKSCFNSLVSDLDVSGLLNDTANNRFGYAVKDHSSNGTLVTSPRVQKGRHAYTTAQTSLTAGSTDTASYGKTMFARVIGGQAFGVLGVAWDFHSDALKCEFLNCFAHGSVVGDTSEGAGFQLRGRNNRIIGGGAYGCQVGLNIFQDFDDANKDNYIEACELDGLATPVVVSGRASSDITGFQMVDCNTRCVAGLKNMIFEYGDFLISGGRHRVDTTSTFNSPYSIGVGATVTVRGGEYIFASGATRFLATMTDNSASAYLDGCYEESGALNAIFSMSGTTASVTSRNLNLSAVPSNDANGLRGVGDTTAVADIEYAVRGKPGIYLTTTDLTDMDHWINRVAKAEGKQVWNITTNRPLWAAGSGATDVWVDGAGVTVHTPS